MDENKLARAAKAAATTAPEHQSGHAKPATSRRVFSVVTLVLGIVTLVAGVIILVLNLTARPAVPDAEYLVNKSVWSLADAPSVEWTFTEVGKGTLTTNSHVNDYNFLWSISGDKLTLETDWLYTLDDTYTYALDQSTATLTLTADDGITTYTFTPVAKVDTTTEG